MNNPFPKTKQFPFPPRRRFFLVFEVVMWKDRFLRVIPSWTTRGRKGSGEIDKLECGERKFDLTMDYWTVIKREDSRKERREKMKLSFTRNKVEMVRLRTSNLV
jgi:hypothetical protein